MDGENQRDLDLEQRVLKLEQKVKRLEKILSDTQQQQENQPLITSNQTVSKVIPEMPVRTRRPEQRSVPKSEGSKVRQPKNKLGEAVVGKYIIGVLASMLIFIAAISLIGLIWRFLTPVMKFGIISGSGILLTVLGGLLTNKYKNPITAIILGTGEGLLFISILSANMSFGFIGSITAIALAGIWSIFFMLSYSYTKMFFTTIIAYIGSFIALLFGLSLVSIGIEFIVLSLFVTGVVAVLVITSNKWLSDGKQITSIILSLVIYSVLILGGTILNSTLGTLDILLAVVLFMVYGLLNYLYKKIDIVKCQPWYLAINFLISLVTLLFLGNIFSIWKDTATIYGCLLAINLIQMIVLEINTKFIRRINIIYYTAVASLSLILLNLKLFELITGLICISIVLLLLQSLKKHKEYTKIALILVLVDTILHFMQTMSRPDSLILSMLYGILQIGLISYILYKNYTEEEFTKDVIFNKIVGLVVYSVNSMCIPILLVSMFIPEESLEPYKYYEIGSILGYLCLSITFVLLNLAGYLKNWYNEEFKWFSRNENVELDNTERVYVIFTFISYFIGLTFLSDADVWYNQFIMVLSVLIVALLQTKTLVEHYKGYKIVGAWIGLKYLILTWVILGSVFDVAFSSVLISVAGLLVALLSISGGFKLQIKSLRLYGLT